MSLPHHAELFKAPQKKFRETVVLVPFFGGRKANLKRHADFLNQYGYDVVLFDLHYPPEVFMHPIFSLRVNKFGLKHHWADQIEDVLNAIPGYKIVYSFSNPSASAIEAITRRHFSDVAGLVCDGGPTSNLWSSMVNYYTHEYKLPTYPLKALAGLGTTLMWSPKFKTVMHDDLKKFPKGFKILSVRGWKDPLIAPKQIDEVFSPHTQIDWRKFALPQGEHLNGLRDFKEDYEKKVSEFLKELSTPV